MLQSRKAETGRGWLLASRLFFVLCSAAGTPTLTLARARVDGGGMITDGG